MKKIRSFSINITLLLVSLCIVTIVIISSHSITIMKNMNTNQVVTHLETLTDSTYNQINIAVEISIKNYLRAIAEKNLDVIKLIYQKYQSGIITEAEAIELVNEILNSQSIGDTGYIYVVNSLGNLKVHPYMKGQNILDFEFIKEQINQKQDYIEYMWKNPNEVEEKEKVLFMTYFEPWDYIISVSSYKSEFNSLVNIDDFKENILATQFGETGYMYILDNEGKLIIHPKLEGTNIYDSVDSKGNYFIQEIIRNKTGTIIYPWINPGEEKEREKIVVYKYYEPMGWYICSGVYIDELTEPFNKIQTRIFYVSIVLIFITIIISMFFSKLILKPIQELIQAMRMVKEGRYDVHINMNRKDEIGYLAELYNEMVVEIKRKTDELENANLTLEKKVEDRTLELQNLSNRDGLTGIANRRKLDTYFEEQLKISRRKALNISVIMLDLDYFKHYNDTYGHVKGDEALILIAKCIDDVLSRETDLVGRYGGEEFVIVLFDTDEDGAVKIAQEIMASIKLLAIEHEASKIDDYVTVSMGIVTENNLANCSVQDLYNNADLALYEAKRSGRNCFIKFNG